MRAGDGGRLARLYAVPGAVIAVGILLPLAWLQRAGIGGGVGARHRHRVRMSTPYLVRFAAVALQSVEAGYARCRRASTRRRACSARRIDASFELRAAAVAPALAAALLVFVDVMKELPATLLLRPFDSDTLAVVAYQLARDERLAEAAAVAGDRRRRP